MTRQVFFLFFGILMTPPISSVAKTVNFYEIEIEIKQPDGSTQTNKVTSSQFGKIPLQDKRWNCSFTSQYNQASQCEKEILVVCGATSLEHLGFSQTLSCSKDDKGRNSIYLVMDKKNGTTITIDCSKISFHKDGFDCTPKK